MGECNSKTKKNNIIKCQIKNIYSLDIDENYFKRENEEKLLLENLDNKKGKPIILSGSRYINITIF